MRLYIKGFRLKLLAVFILQVKLSLSNLSPSLSPSLDLNCNFEDGFCGWKNSEKLHQWRRQRGNLTDIVNGPGIDHTFPTGEGYYAYVQAPMETRKEFHVRLESYSFQPSPNGTCFSFAYHMFGIQVKSLEVAVDLGGLREVIWSRSGSQGNEWHEANIMLPNSSTPIKITISAFAQFPQYIWSIALDDIFVRQGHQCLHPSNWCDFEDGSCDFIPINNSWRVSGVTSSSSYLDHTTGSFKGHFAYIQPLVSGLRLTKELTSIKQGPTNDSCLEFWFMILDGGSSLDIQIKYWGNESRVDNLLRLTATEKSQWSPINVPIISNANYQIILKASLLFKIVAIDDVILRNRTCEIPDYCTFQHGFCEWRNDGSYSDVHWLRSIGGVPINKFPAPETDATYTDSGYFIFFPVKNLPENSVATLRSKPLSYGPLFCFRMMYNIHHIRARAGELKANLNLANGIIVELLKVTEETGESKWSGIAVSIACNDIVPTLKFQITIEATAGNGEGYIALDDIQITNGSCTSESLQPPPSGLPECFVYPVGNAMTSTILSYTTELPSEITGANSSATLFNTETTEANSSSSIYSTETTEATTFGIETTETDKFKTTLSNETTTDLTPTTSTYNTTIFQSTSEQPSSTIDIASSTPETTGSNVSSDTLLTETTVDNVSTSTSTDPTFTLVVHMLTSSTKVSPSTAKTTPPTVDNCANNTSECQMEKAPSFLTENEAVVYITIPIVSVLVCILVIILIAVYRHRNPSYWFHILGQGKCCGSRHISYDQNSMKDEPMDVTDSAIQSALHRGLIVVDRSYDFENRRYGILELPYNESHIGRVHPAENTNRGFENENYIEVISPAEESNA